MSTERELSDLKERYRNASTEDLLRVVHSRHDFRAEAVEIAREVLKTRDLTQARVTAVVAELAEEIEARQLAAEEPLGAGWKAFCFFLCGVPGILFAAYQWTTGRSRRAQEAWNWIALGWFIRLALFMFLYLSSVR